MSRYINPFTDWGFKMIFGQEANKDILIFFLNELLKGERKIEDLTFLDKERLGESLEERCIVYDIYCTTDTGEHIIVEMQNKEQSYFLDRSLYYLSKAIVSQGEKGNDWKYKVNAVYGVFFMNFRSSDGLDDKLRTDVVMTDRETGRVVSTKMRLIYLQLPCFNKREDECEDNFERMIYVLKKMEVLKRMPFEKQAPVFERLAKIAEVRKLTDKEKRLYDESLKNYRDYNNTIDTAEKKGISKGEIKERIKGVKKLKEMGYDDKFISEVFGISAEDVNNLLDE